MMKLINCFLVAALLTTTVQSDSISNDKVIENGSSDDGLAGNAQSPRPRDGSLLQAILEKLRGNYYGKIKVTVETVQRITFEQDPDMDCVCSVCGGNHTDRRALLS